MTDLKDFSEQFEAWWLTKFSAEFLDSDNCWSAWTGWQARGELDAGKIKELEGALKLRDSTVAEESKLFDELTAKNKELEGIIAMQAQCIKIQADKIESLKKAIEIKPLSEILGEDE